MKYKFVIPTPSAKRLEKDRCFVIVVNSAFDRVEREFPIPEDAEDVEFEFKFIESDPNWRHIMDDGDASISYSWHVRYRNSTGSREEKIGVELTPKPSPLVNC